MVLTLRIDDQYDKALKEIAAVWGNVTSKSDVVRYCIWYTWKHAIKNNK